MTLNNKSTLHSAYTYSILYQLIRYNLNLHHTDAYGYYQASINVKLLTDNNLQSFDYFYDGLSDQLDPTDEVSFLDNVSEEILNHLLESFNHDITYTNVNEYKLSNDYSIKSLYLPILIDNTNQYKDNVFNETYLNHLTNDLKHILVNNTIDVSKLTPNKFYLSYKQTLDNDSNIYHYTNILNCLDKQFNLEYLLISGIDLNNVLLSNNIIIILNELNIDISHQLSNKLDYSQ